MKQLLVIDASVILKWVFQTADEQDGDRALLLLNGWIEGEHDILLPRLWTFEVGNVIGLKSPATAPELLTILTDYGFKEAETTAELCRATIDLMSRYGVTFYDAVYHAVALLHGGLLVTADDAYRKKAQAAGAIRLLRNV
jgi:predicted nucleic acid-binding protein